jgi:hypothetical protein
LLRRSIRRLGTGTLIAVALGLAGPAAAQTPTPSPSPDTDPRQDEFDFQGRSSIVRGSGARALGMGGAFLARPDDATAASWNPAGLSYLRRPELSIVWAQETFDNETRTRLFDEDLDQFVEQVTYTDHFRGRAPDFLATAYPVRLGAVSGAVQFSFQRVISFANERDINRVPSAPLRHVGRGGFDVLALGTGLQVSERLRIGGTINRWVNGFDQLRERLERRRLLLRSEFDLSAWNVNLGIIWEPVEGLNLGAVGKTAFTANIRLRRARIDIGSGQGASPDSVTTNRHERDDVRLDFPGAVGFGASWRPWSPLTLSADYTLSFWSGGRIRNYFTLQPAPQPPTEFPEPLPYPELEGTQKDTEQIRFGVEHVLIWGRAKIPLRAGYFNDRQHFVAGADQRPPRFDGFTAGTGLLLGPFLLDVAYVHEFGKYDDLDPEGNPTRTTIRFPRLFVSVIYRHGASR